MIFIGDSIAYGWNGDKFFDSSEFSTSNLGVIGSRLADFEERHSGQFSGKDVVVIIGTNDSHSINPGEPRKKYTEKYVNVLKSLDANHIYLFSILPRN